MNRPVHFEIHATDPGRAAKFYEAAFGWDIKKWDNPMADYWIIMTGPDGQKGINGGLLVRHGPPATEENQPVNAFVCTIEVASLDATAARINSAGGINVLPKQQIPGMGWLAYFKDTEGNIFGVMENDPQVK